MIHSTDKNKAANDKDTFQAAQSDYQLVLRVRNNDIAAFETIMRRHNQRLYRIARSMTGDESEAMDVVQEAYIKAYYRIHQFKGPQGFATWLSRITANEAMTRIRKSSSVIYMRDEQISNSFDIQSKEPGPMENLANKQLHLMLEDEIDRLPLNYRDVYVMRAIQQLSTLETAEILEVSESVVKTRYRRAKQMLQKRFATHLENAQLNVFEFAGYRCDAIVNYVLNHFS